jgi:zinc transport system substrate-binding protein
MLLLLALALAVAVVAACGADEGGAAGGDERLDVVASFYPVAEVAGRVGGDRVDVTNLTPAGTEPHDVELAPDQVDQLLDADVVLFVGESFQPAVTEIASGRPGLSLDLLDALDLGDGEEDDVDPHFWLDPRLLAAAAGEVADALATAAPDDAGRFADNARRYGGELSELDVELAEGLADCRRRELVTAHAAFSYLAERYALTPLAVAGLSPEAEPDADRIARLVDQVEAHGVTTVFYEELVSPRVAATVALEAGVETAVLSPVEGLTEEQHEAGKDYAAVMRDNLGALRRALGCR